MIKNIKILSVICCLCIFLQACLSDKDLFKYEHEFDNGVERVVFDDVVLGVRRGDFLIDVGSKKILSV